jgi:hypothetical protein
LTHIISSISELNEITVKLQECKELITPVMKLMEIVQDSNSSQDENVIMLIVKLLLTVILEVMIPS